MTSEKAMADDNPVRSPNDFKWRKAEPPRTWSPTEQGEELVGFYWGRTLRRGRYGPYEVAMLAVPGQGVWVVSGIKVIQLIDSSLVEVGQPLRIVFGGVQKLKDGKKTMKLFECFVTDGERVSVETLPEVEIR
jgi:hypothetical protein